MTIAAAEAAARLGALIEQVNDDHAAVEITSTRGVAHLVPADEYRSLSETAYLLRSPRNARRLRASVAETARFASECSRSVTAARDGTAKTIDGWRPRRGCWSSDSSERRPRDAQ